MEDPNNVPSATTPADTIFVEIPEAPMDWDDEAICSSAHIALEKMRKGSFEAEDDGSNPTDEVMDALGDVELPFSNPDLRPDTVLLPVADLMHTYRMVKDIKTKSTERNTAKADKAGGHEVNVGDDVEKPRETITFEVQKTEVQLPRAAVENSEFFAPVLAALDASQPSGRLIILKDTTLADFGALVKVIDGEVNLTTSEWMSVLDLATKWKLLTARQVAISHLLRLPDKPFVMKLALGKQFYSKSLVKSAYLDLLVREEHMTQDELDHLGAELVLRLASLREKAHYDSWHATCNTIPKDWHRWAIKASEVVFKEDLVKMASPPDLVDQILLARKAGFPDLLKVGCLKLAERDNSLSTEEFARLGDDLGLKLLEARLEFRRIAHEASDMRWGESDDKVAKLVRALDILFKDEFEALEQAYQSYRPSFDDVLSPRAKVDVGDILKKIGAVA